MQGPSFEGLDLTRDESPSRGLFVMGPHADDLNRFLL